MGEICGRCANTGRWWRSKTGYMVCMVCTPDVWDALEVLARRQGAGAVAQVKRWRTVCEEKGTG
jgi:hypothetical protein